MNKAKTLLVALLVSALLAVCDAYVEQYDDDYVETLKKRGILQGFSVPVDLRDIATAARKIRAEDDGGQWSRDRRRLPKSLIRAITSEKAQNRFKFRY